MSTSMYNWIRVEIKIWKYRNLHACRVRSCSFFLPVKLQFSFQQAKFRIVPLAIAVVISFGEFLFTTHIF